MRGVLLTVLISVAMALVAMLDIPAGPPAAWASPGETAWSAEVPGLSERIERGEPLVIQVVVPLCHNGQIVCGDHGLGAPDRPATNLYWGALYGARRFFERKGSGWTAVAQSASVEGVLERAVFRRFVPGRIWNRRAPVEQLVVLDAIDGNAIDGAVDGFFRGATEGATVTIEDGRPRRELAVAAMGYAGHNRLMDGKRLPPARDRGRAVPSFVLACESGAYFAEPLRTAGSRPLVTTRTLMAPEGYVVEAMARALGDNGSPRALRGAVVRAYAKWQKLSVAAAGRIFTPVPRRTRRSGTASATRPGP